VIGGNRDGVSGPGVGAVENDVQGAAAAPGILVTVGFGCGVGAICVEGEAHDASMTIRMEDIAKSL